jgi:cytochrome b
VGGRGGRRMMPFSAGSKARVRPSSTAVVMLIQRICKGVMGSVAPARMAATITSPSPALVGMVQVMNFTRLS